MRLHIRAGSAQIRNVLWRTPWLNKARLAGVWISWFGPLYTTLLMHVDDLAFSLTLEGGIA